METPARVVRSVHLDLDRDAAWRLVGTADGLARWLGADVHLDPAAGAALRVRDDDGVERHGRVVEVDEGRSLAFEWATDEGTPSSVTFTVDDDGDGSRVTVVEEHAGGSMAACLDAGAAWDHRMLHLEVGALGAVPAFAGRGAALDLMA
ncbi:SRPBCC domain-containing protein [Iamia sp. SCSIO 61187]|uniref:SRPBCC family protein n=1 Tax=Iamia sp. SCSIO 61187 TaxID=2722752 RepID=UPI001C62DC49|nr:SRPBCC domain-containing protein [Iamia sp. SCSIO 61187]QYG94742.1 SRPBCC domain-containing protein [Iamia sp. SCSIO 61187]